MKARTRELGLESALAVTMPRPERGLFAETKRASGLSSPPGDKTRNVVSRSSDQGRAGVKRATDSLSHPLQASDINAFGPVSQKRARTSPQNSEFQSKVKGCASVTPSPSGTRLQTPTSTPPSSVDPASREPHFRAQSRSRASSHLSPLENPGNIESCARDVELRSGIVNLGNTCYLGAALQALLCDTEFLSDVRKCSNSSDPDRTPFANALLDMNRTPMRNAKSLMNGSVPTAASQLSPELVISAISTHFVEFGTTAQQDVQEFIMRCFFVLERELAEPVHRCPVSRNFSVVVENSSSCLTCSRTTTPRNELLRDLSLNMPPNPSDSEKQIAGDNTSVPSLIDLLKGYFVSQEVDLTCENESCPGLRASTNSGLALLPRVLVLHLKRFRVECDTSRVFSLVKVSDPVHIPEVLNLEEVLKSHALGPSVLDEHSNGKMQDADCHSDASVTPRMTKTAIDMGPNVVNRMRVGLPAPCGQTNFELGARTLLDKIIAPSSESAASSTRDHDVVRYDQATSDTLDTLPVADSANGGGETIAAKTPVRGRLYKVFCEAAEEDQRRPQHSASKPAAVDAIVKSTQDEISGAEQDDVEEFEMTQNPHRVKHNLRDDTAVQIVCNELSVSAEDARSALAEVNFDVTRATGLLLDKRRGVDERYVEDEKCRVNSVLELVAERMLTRQPGVNVAGAAYKLNAIIRHCSSVAEHGHYVCDIRQADDSWACYNDESVEISMSAPFEQLDRQKDGYMFFYRLQS
jgi:ubiquitin C-terminal hydrolase/NACalpha-BTF3-like transcription factor